jgi:hypothetical protein
MKSLPARAQRHPALFRRAVALIEPRQVQGIEDNAYRLVERHAVLGQIARRLRRISVECLAHWLKFTAKGAELEGSKQIVDRIQGTKKIINDAIDTRAFFGDALLQFWSGDHNFSFIYLLYV